MAEARYTGLPIVRAFFDPTNGAEMPVIPSDGDLVSVSYYRVKALSVEQVKVCGIFLGAWNVDLQISESFRDPSDRAGLRRPFIILMGPLGPTHVYIDDISTVRVLSRLT